TARLWEVWPETEPHTLASFVGGYHLDLFVVNISPDKQHILTGWTDGTIQVWDVNSGDIIERVDFQAIDVNAQVMSANNRFIFAGDSSGMVRMVDAQTSEVIHKFEGHTGAIQDIALSPDGKLVVSGSEDQTAQLWRVETGQEIGRFVDHQGAVRAVAFSPQGDVVLTGSDDNLARLWDIETGQAVRQFVGHTAAVLDVAFSSDGHYILTGSDDDTARLWDAQTGQEVRAFIGHTDQVSQVAFSSDNRFILTGSADQTARLWASETGQIVRQFVGHNTPLRLVAFSGDGQSVITADSYGTFLWRTNLDDVVTFVCHQLSRDLSQVERTLYNIADTTSICPNPAAGTVETDPTWTPVPTTTIKAAPLLLSAAIKFQSEAANVQDGLPVQDAFIEAGNGQVVRPQVLNEETLALPVYRSAEEVPLDFMDAPFDVGPYPQGEPLGFTLGDYVAAEGQGTYTVQGNQAVVDLTFNHLVPHGMYTLWCSTLHFPTSNMDERPCLAPDGSRYSFTADESGQAALMMEIEAFPPSTEADIYEIGVAYHSDGQTHGDSVGAHGMNAHGQLFFDFLPPEPPAPASSSPLLSPVIIQFAFLTDAANLDLGAPMQDVFIEAGDGQIVRPQEMSDATLAQPLYRATKRIEPDFLEEPFEVGPFAKGEPHGFTLAEWLAATGQGTYTVTGNQAVLDLTFENLRPNGIYTLWCSEVHLPPHTNIIDRPCGAPDGSDNRVPVDEQGYGEITLDMAAFPPSSEDTVYSISLAYHSDGQTYGTHPGEFGYNLHVQLFYELPASADH
ncbi:MAG: WD40 repeat domain-containing protein, partial [Anaerolineae bacterium]|nr:WD40 repeat domain-containing protein [Anaerolineae bacterium]